MLSSPKQTLIVAISTVLALCSTLASTSLAQDSEFQQRLAAMRQARARAAQPAQVETQPLTQPVVANQAVVVTQTAPPTTSVVQQAGAQVAVSTPNNSSRMLVQQASGSRPIMRRNGNASIRRGFVPRHVRTAQVMDGTIVDGGAPIMNSPMTTMVHDGTMMNSTIVDGQVVTQPYVEGGVVDGMVVEGCGDGCNSCGEVGGYFDECCDRGGCPECQDCWINRFGVALRNSEFYSGFTSFRSSLFTNPSTANNNLLDDCSHGYYGGVNFGMPLCRLTCGALSGQFGLRTVNTNFNGNAFTADDRNQLFMTAGFFRRVDQGLQFGVVADVLREEWYANADLVQIRGDLGFVFASGTTFGFKFATNVQDDVVNGTINNQPFAGQLITTNENYRFYMRHDAKAGGWGELFAGWSETNQGIIGLDFDMPITNRVAVEAGFTYFLNDDGVPANGGLIGGNQGQAYNTYIGIALRPSGRRFYRNYDRPLFDVADNGSMSTVR